MQESMRSAATRTTLPVILLAAVVQGWALYALHHALKHQHWPANDPAWLVALYMIAILVPISVQLLAQYVRQTSQWVLLVPLSIAFFYFGWHHGGSVYDSPSDHFGDSGEFFPLTCVTAVLWLLLLPFVQSRLVAGRWSVPYEALFTTAWRNKLLLAEALLFSGLFWLLLVLWQALFHMLGIDFFKELFEEPIFVYPVTCLAFGCALHLIGSIERLTAAVLEQILNLLKWLAVLAGFILALFTIALIAKLPGLVFTGHKAIGAAWLLWLVAVVVLFLNAAYRDGSVAEPYPKWIAQALRAVVPLTVIIAVTALYALGVRTRHYGLTVERVWALIIAATALVYAGGYTICAFARGPWLGGIARVNVFTAVALIVVLAATLTPLLSPFRLAAMSQFRMAEEHAHEFAEVKSPRESPFYYLRFDSGQYGRAKLAELAALQNHPNAQLIRTYAQQAIAQTTRYAAPLPLDTDKLVAKLAIFPSGRSLDAELAKTLAVDWRNPQNGLAYQYRSNDEMAGLFIDLNGDHVDEFVLLTASSGLVYENQGGHWRLVGGITSERKYTPWPVLAAALAKGNFTATTPTWKVLVLGGQSFRVSPK